MSEVNWLITDKNITVNYDGQTHIVPRTATLADKLIDAIKSGRKEEIPELVSAAARIEKASDGTFVVEDGQILVDGEIVHDYDITGLQSRRKDVFGPDGERGPVHRTVKHPGRLRAVAPHGGNHGGSLPTTAGDPVENAFTAASPTVEPRHVGLCTGFVDKE